VVRNKRNVASQHYRVQGKCQQIRGYAFVFVVLRYDGGMDFLTNMLVGSAHTLEYSVTLVLAALLFVSVLRRGALRVLSVRTWWMLAAAWQVVFAGMLTSAQYRMWQGNEMTRELVTTPLAGDVPRLLLHAPVMPFLDGSSGYYVFYAYTHFWVPFLLALLGAGAVYGIFRFLQHRKPVAVGNEEVLLISGVAFLAGWPNMVVFVSLAFVLTVLHALYAHVRYGAAARTRMLPSIIAAAVITLLLQATIAAYTATLAV